MFVAFNIVALLLMLAVVYMSWVMGVYRAAASLVACVLAGAIAFGFYGPVAGLLPGFNDLRSVWYYAGDAVVLWALFCVAFLGLKALGEKLLREAAEFPRLLNSACGAVLGLGTGYLAVGIGLVLAQMLPLNPDDIFGAYSPFKYERDQSAAARGPTLWLNWDRETLAFFNYLSMGPLGSKEHGFFERYGDVYVDPRHVKKAEDEKVKYEPVLNSDDFLYYHWYRRWEYVWWRTGVSQGPVPEDYPVRTGMSLVQGRAKAMGGLQVRVAAVTTSQRIESFDQERVGGEEQFVIVSLLIGPAGQVPVMLDSSQLVLLGPNAEKFTGPLVFGHAQSVEGAPQVLTRTPSPAEAVGRDVRFAVPDPRREGRYLMSGATLTFKNLQQEDLREYIFVVPKNYRPADLRLVVEPPAAKETKSTK